MRMDKDENGYRREWIRMRMDKDENG